jgi:hypothetical protein
MRPHTSPLTAEQSALVAAWYGLVAFFVNKHGRGACDEQLDAMHDAATTQLMDSARRWDASLGVPFKAYAARYINIRTWQAAAKWRRRRAQTADAAVAIARERGKPASPARVRVKWEELTPAQWQAVRAAGNGERPSRTATRTGRSKQAGHAMTKSLVDSVTIRGNT